MSKRVELTKLPDVPFTELDPNPGGGDIEHKQRALGIAAVNKEFGRNDPSSRVEVIERRKSRSVSIRDSQAGNHELDVGVNSENLRTRTVANLPTGRYSTAYDENKREEEPERDLHSVERSVPQNQLPKHDRKMESLPEHRNYEEMPHRRSREGEAARARQVYRVPEVKNKARKSRMAEIVDKHVTSALAASAQTRLDSGIEEARARVEELEALRKNSRK